MFSLIQPRTSSAGDISPSPSSSMTSNARFKVKMVNSTHTLTHTLSRFVGEFSTQPAFIALARYIFLNI